MLLMSIRSRETTLVSPKVYRRGRQDLASDPQHPLATPYKVSLLSTSERPPKGNCVDVIL